MTQDEIIKMARQAGMLPHSIYDFAIYVEELEAFAKLVASAAKAKEREACARICETLWNTPDNGMATEEECYGDQCAKAIRARGEA
jgi:hypothetical protein